MIIRRSMTLWLLLATCAGISLFLVKHEVQKREDRLNALHREILADQEAIQVLRAEWSYLNRPERLERLVRDLEDKQPAVQLQITSFELLPQFLNAADDVPETQNGTVLPMLRPVSLGARR